MKILKDQTIYQCEYCKKRLLSRFGAKIHEEGYCKNPNSPNQLNKVEKQKQCKHKNTAEEYRYIPGEAVIEPNYIKCLDCGVHL